MNASHSGSWTYQHRHRDHSGRYDRVYVHDSTSSVVESVRMEDIDNVWGDLSDHKPLRVVVRRKPRASARAPLLQAIDNSERVEDGASLGASVGNSVGAKASAATSSGAPLLRATDNAAQVDAEVAFGTSVGNSKTS